MAEEVEPPTVLVQLDTMISLFLFSFLSLSFFFSLFPPWSFHHVRLHDGRGPNGVDVIGLFMHAVSSARRLDPR
jgi:hypothetical protein